MRFRTELEIAKSIFKIEYPASFLTIGSCFSERIGVRLHDAKFEVINNPTGTVYNPFSLALLFSNAINNSIDEDQFLEREGYYYSFDYHSSIFGENQYILMDKIKEVNDNLLKGLNSDYLIITLGTSVVYSNNGEFRPLNNCHKLPGSKFDKNLLNLDFSFQYLEKCFSSIFEINPPIKIILTVSPVRHIKDNLVTNSFSKSLLIVLAYKLAEYFPNLEYFPSYEIMMDDLRDYRFYSEDLIHPNKFAEDYIWEKFMGCYFSESTSELYKKVKEIKARISHKPFNSVSPSHQKFIQETLNLIDGIKNIDLLEEKELLRRNII